MITEQCLAVFALSQIAGIGPAKISRLLDKFGSITNVFEKSVSELSNCGIINTEQAK